MEATDIPTCRICMDEGQTSDLISPCDCRGSMGFIHRHCLDQWYAIRRNEICDTCHCEYAKELCGIKPIFEWWKLPPLHFQLRLDEDIFLEFLPAPVEHVSKIFYRLLISLFTSLLYAIFLRYYKEDSLFGFSPRMMMACDSIFIFFGLMRSLTTILTVVHLLYFLCLWIDSLMIYRWKNKSNLPRICQFKFVNCCHSILIFVVLYPLIFYYIFLLIN